MHIQTTKDSQKQPKKRLEGPFRLLLLVAIVSIVEKISSFFRSFVSFVSEADSIEAQGTELNEQSNVISQAASSSRSQAREAIYKLEQELERISILSVHLAYPTESELQQLVRIGRILNIARAVVNNFEYLNVEIHPMIAVPQHLPLDLFIKLPQAKQFFAIAVWSFGEGKIVYNEQKEALYRRVPKGGLYQWQPDPLEELTCQEFWLRKNRRDLFGKSSNDARRPVVKILAVLTTTIAAHNEHLYQNMNGHKYLRLRRKGSFIVLPEEEVINFMYDWLDEEKKKAS